MRYYDLKITNKRELRFQVEAESEQEAIEMLRAAMEESPDSIQDVVDEYGDVSSEIDVDDVIEDEKWAEDSTSIVVPGIWY